MKKFVVVMAMMVILTVGFFAYAGAGTSMPNDTPNVESGIGEVVQVNMPNLKTIGGTLNVIGRKDLSEDSFPNLETVGGHIHLALSGFTKLPDSLLSVAGNVYITEEPNSLVQSCLKKKRAGIIKGHVILVGGKISSKENGEIEYGETHILQ